MTANEPHSLRGGIDRAALFDIKSEFERLEPLASGDLDSITNPRRLRLTLDDGIDEAEGATLDVRWAVTGDYNAHHSDETRDFRWDVHAHDYPVPQTDAHHHPPPDASNDPADVVASCIEVAPPKLVARALHVLWRRAYDRGTVEGLNTIENPP